jgi:transposase
MKQILIVGLDVSKSTLDLFIKPWNRDYRVANNNKGHKNWLEQIEPLLEPDHQLLVVMEHTGLYSNVFEMFLQLQGIDYCKIPALQIKRSMGVVRGKNDKVDAERISEYGWLRRDILTADQLPDKQVTELRQLLSLRTKLVKDRSGYMTRLKEMKVAGICDPFLNKTQQRIIESLSKPIALIEERIEGLIEDTQELKNTYELLRSIKGVGKIIATYMICCTGNFKKFKNARKFNCYAGLAPFKYESGSSIRSRSKVSHLANKEAKALLNLAACCAIRCDSEMKQYYHKRVTEGKRKMSCLNIIRSKLVARMFAVIKRQTPYQERLLAA